MRVLGLTFATLLWMGIRLLPVGAEQEGLAPSVAEQRLPAWLLLEQGKKVFQQGKYGEALRLFMAARQRLEFFPEASYLIGRVYEADSNFDIAILQYQRALAGQDYLFDSSEKYAIYMALANAYYRAQMVPQYEQTLLDMAGLELKPTLETLRKERQIEKILQERKTGIDRILYFYAESYPNVLPALNELALHNYSIGNYSDSIHYNLYSIISSISMGSQYLVDKDLLPRIPNDPDDLLDIFPDYVVQKLSSDLDVLGLEVSFEWDLQGLKLKNQEVQMNLVIEKIREVDPEYLLRSLIGFYLEVLTDNAVTRALMQKNHLYRQLYFLGSTLVTQGFRDSGNYILRTLKYLPEAGEWNRRAVSQLRQPFVDRQVPIGSSRY